MLWVKYVDADGAYAWKSTGCQVGQEKQAAVFLRTVIEEVAAQRRAGVRSDEPLTVARFAKRWVAKRRARHIVSAGDDEARLKNHVLPLIGSVLLSDVTTDHVRTVMESVMEKVGEKTMAPRTARHVYATMRILFKKAKAFLPINPCCLDTDELPENVDENPAWRVTAVFTRAEIEAMLSDPRIPVDRRIFWALVFLGAGQRFGEAAASAWGDYDATLVPLGRLLVTKSYSTRDKVVGTVKTEVSRAVPVHPVLAEVLAGWREHGWRVLTGRAPEATDLIVPSRTGRCRSANHMLKKFHQDLERIGLRKRRQHDLRRTFISLCRADGGRGDILRFITHGPNKGDVFDSYTTLPWEALCAEVAKLRINLSGSDVLSGRASSEIATTSKPVDPRGDGETVTRTVTFAVTIPSASRGSVIQLHETPQDFSQGVLRGGRDLKLAGLKTKKPSEDATLAVNSPWLLGNHSGLWVHLVASSYIQVCRVTAP